MIVVLAIRRMKEKKWSDFIKKGSVNDLKCLQFINIPIAR